MGPLFARHRPPPFQELLRHAEFNAKELLELHEQFLKRNPDGYMRETDLKKLFRKKYPEGDPEAFNKYVFQVYDRDGNGKIDFREFVLTLSAAMRGTWKQKLDFAFSICDVNGDGFITKDEMRRVISVIALSKISSQIFS